MSILILLVFGLINGSIAANILGLMHVASPSHSIWNNVLIKGLAERGHNITVIISDLPKNPKDIQKNVSYFSIEDVYSGVYESMDIKDLFNIPSYVMTFEFCSYCSTNCKSALKSKGFNNFMKEYDGNFKFDIILYDFTCGPCLIGLLERFKYPPLVGISAFPVPSFSNSFSGGQDHPSYISYHSALLNPSGNIVDRFYNHFLYYLENLVKRFSFYPGIDEMVRENHFPKTMKSVRDLEKYVTISLVNFHASIEPAESSPPNVIDIGGLQLVDPEPLPKDLENFIESSKNGAILFSLGTNVRPEDLTDEHIDIFITVFKKLPQYNFMWKFDENRIKIEIPKNIMIKKFFPQRDILANPKTVAFISHMGGLSTQESIWYGVPMIGIPLFADQLRNIWETVQKEIAVHVDFIKLSKKSFESAIREILENKKYSDNIKLMSKRFRDRPMKPLDTAIWWIEYILRNPKPDHLKPKSLEMNYFTANSLDFYFIVITCLNIIIFTIVGIIWSCCCKKDKGNTKKKIKSN